MTEQELSLLGLTKTDVLDKLVDKLCEHFVAADEEYRNDFEHSLSNAVKKRVDERIEAAVANHVLPNITAMVDGICLQETNRWGEARGTKLTFVEYLTQRVDAYIREEVDHNGKGKSEDAYHWRASSTRIAYMIHEHLQYSIKTAMANALGEVNSSVRKGLEEAVKLALSKLQVKVDTTVREQ